VPSYDTLRNKQAELIRKALDGSVFLAPIDADPIDELTVFNAAVVGPPAVPAFVDLAPLPTDWDDLGWLSPDGAQFARDIANSEVTSWGSVTPTRTDITSDTTTLTVVAQETKLLTIGLATGADLANIEADPDSGEVKIAKPARPRSRHWRALSLAVDEAEGGEIYIARFLPRAKVSSYAEQSFGQGDDPVTWGVTLTGEVDDDLGYSEQWIFGGAGWKALLTQMGIPNAA
jgi:hypothetical protein